MYAIRSYYDLFSTGTVVPINPFVAKLCENSSCSGVTEYEKIRILPGKELVILLTIVLSLFPKQVLASVT